MTTVLVVALFLASLLAAASHYRRTVERDRTERADMRDAVEYFAAMRGTEAQQ